MSSSLHRWRVEKPCSKRDGVFRLVIRGAQKDFAALCATDQVFEIKSAETSNTLLLASPLDASSANKENGCVSLKVNYFRRLYPCRHPSRRWILFFMRNSNWFHVCRNWNASVSYWSRILIEDISMIWMTPTKSIRQQKYLTLVFTVVEQSGFVRS